MIDNTQQKDVINNPKRSKPKAKRFFNIFTILLMIGALISGIFFSTQYFSENYKLGSDFKGHYSALVAVSDISADAKESQNNQPNGDAREAASVLEQRLNPMGTNQIIVETAGANYLKVLSPIDAYNSETEFKNQIQRNGGAIILNKDLKDMQFTDDTRKGINEYFTSAKSTSITSNAGKNPAIEFDLNGETFTSLFGESESEISSTIMIDADGLYNDIRNWYNLVPGNDLRTRVESFYDNVIRTLKISYNAAGDNKLDENQKKVIDDLFIGRYLERSTGNVEQYRYVNVLNIASDREGFVTTFTNYLNNGFEYVSDTSKYVYDPNATTDDFAAGGKYSQNVNGNALSGSGGVSQIELGVIRDVFERINTFMVKFVRDSINSWTQNSKIMETKIQSYFLMDGTIFKSAGSTNGNILLANSYIRDNKLIIEYSNQPESKARIGAAIFNASTRGFVFTVNNISAIGATITSIMLWVSAAFLLCFVLALLIYALIAYRVMGIIMLAIISAITMLTLLASTWFSLTLGAEAIFAVFIITAINLEIFSMIFEQTKFNIFLKQRNTKVSYSIAVKETITLAVDMLVALIIPAISMFWISTNAIQSFAILVLMGVAFSFVIGLLFGLILYKLVIATNMFENKAALFALNTDFANQNNAWLAYKLRTLRVKLDNLNNATSKNAAKISVVTNKIAVIEQKISKIDEKVKAKNLKLTEKYKSRITKKITKLETKKTKHPKKVFKLDLKIEELKFILADDTQEIIEAESEILLSTNAKVKTNVVEKQIKRGSKIFAIVIASLTAVAAVIGGLFGPNYDNTFGNRTEYTIWGNQLDQVYTAIENVPNRTDIDESLRSELVDLLSNQSTGTNSEISIEYTVSSFLTILFNNPSYVNQVAQLSNMSTRRQYQNHKFIVSHGSSFTFQSGSTSDEDVPWVTLAVMTTNSTQSQAIRNLFTVVGGLNREQAVSENGGYITKQIRASTILRMSVQISYALLSIVLVMLIYILIRFKWTYYIAMVIGIVLVPAITLAAVIALHLSFGVGVLVAISISMLVMVTSMMSVFGKSRSLIATKDENSLKQFFKEEISLSAELKNLKRMIRDEIFVQKTEKKVALKADNLTKEDIVKIKNDFKKYKHEKWLSYKDKKRETKIQINRVSRKNNYLKEVMVQTFKYGLKRSILVGLIYIAFAVLFLIAFTPIATIGIAIVIAVVASIAVMLLICLPIWMALEQIRIRNHLSRKHFINNLKVSREEQIIEGIND
ncbi:bifunctional preprotein translocase subunit SecD/SecF [Spiroplasma clarkii]|uniref:Bifunctional preprotein translocase subunit SecD/SecF n=1 Tax=Spiroplasma clarkii TaxID=2139 RepID=A0A2K8KHA3_9MOLU|nr:protein translocase SecDF, variant type [Spiroplasma clarkii]ATX71045.1 bifunctional preprotein translocase subunit SecD/SecF [Spiroplasma clarkii]